MDKYKKYAEAVELTDFNRKDFLPLGVVNKSTEEIMCFCRGWDSAKIVFARKLVELFEQQDKKFDKKLFLRQCGFKDGMIAELSRKNQVNCIHCDKTDFYYERDDICNYCGSSLTRKNWKYVKEQEFAGCDCLNQGEHKGVMLSDGKKTLCEAHYEQEISQ